MAQHIRDLGSFESIQQVWTALPGGGMEGDYLTINGNPFAWNKYIRQWQNDTTVINNPARETQTHDGDMNIGNDARIGGNLVVIGNIINDSIKNGLSAFELAVKGGYQGTEEQWLNSLIGKSAYQIWLEQAGNAGKGIEYFLAWMKDTKAIKGPKYIEDETLIDTVNDRMTIFYVNNGTSYKVVFVDEQGYTHTLANRIGDITNYAGIYDVSADNELDGGIPKRYASLPEAVADIADNAKKGGMEIKYIDYNSWKYRQFRYLLASNDLNDLQDRNNWEEIDFSAANVSFDNSAVGLVSENIQSTVGEIASYLFNDRIEVTDLVQGHINANGELVSSTQTRVSTQYIDVIDNDLILHVTGNFFIRNANRYTQSSQSVLFGAEMYHGYKLEKGYRYRVTFCKEDRTQNLSPSELEGKVFLIPLPNNSVRQIENKVEDNSNEIAFINNLVEDIDGGGDAIQFELSQGYVNASDAFVPYDYRVTTGVIDATNNSVVIDVNGGYSVRNGNYYTADGRFIGQYYQTEQLTHVVLPMGFKYRMTIWKTGETTASITPEQVIDHVTIRYVGKRLIVAKVKETESKVNSLVDTVGKAGKYLIYDDFSQGYNSNNYTNFNSAKIVNGSYSIDEGWANRLKLASVISFHDFGFELDVNTTDNSEIIAISTEETEEKKTGYYGSCAYIDLNASKMYLLQPSLFDDSHQPSVSNKVKEVSLDNIDSNCHRYIVTFGKRNRNLFVSLRNYYTNEIVELISDNTTNATGVNNVGNGYDKLRIASMSGAISVNNIVGITKTNVDILFVGDSVTDGRGIALADSWAYKLGSYLTDNFAIAARSGGQIQQVINLLSKWGRYINAKVIIVSVGVNGGNTNEKFLELYNLIIGLNAIPVINTIYNVSDNFNNIGDTEWSDTNNYILSLPCKHVRFDIATSLNKYSPIFRQLDANYSLIDNVHPNGNGSVLLYERAVADLKQLELLI